MLGPIQEFEDLEDWPSYNPMHGVPPVEPELEYELQVYLESPREPRSTDLLLQLIDHHDRPDSYLNNEFYRAYRPNYPGRSLPVHGIPHTDCIDIGAMLPTVADGEPGDRRVALIGFSAMMAAGYINGVPRVSPPNTGVDLSRVESAAWHSGRQWAKVAVRAAVGRHALS